MSTAEATVRTGYLAITDAGTAASLGYVGSMFDGGGLYVTTADPAQQLQVSFDDAAAPFSIAALNNAAAAPFPAFGAIQGVNSNDANLGAGSSSYAIVVGTTQTPSGAGPVPASNSFIPFFDPVARLRPAESAVWSLSGMGALTAQWVNTDGALPVTSIVLSQDILDPAESVLILTGDPAASAAIFGPGPTVDLTFVPTDVPEPAGVAVLAAGLLSLRLLRRRA